MNASLSDLNESVKQNKWLRNLEDDMKNHILLNQK